MNRISVPIKETPQSSLAPSCEDSKKVPAMNQEE